MVQSGTSKRNSLHQLGYKIFLDRYALKDMTRETLSVGDTVIVVVDTKTGQREVGKVTALDLPRVTVELLDGEVIERDIEHIDKPLETEPKQMMDRVARGIAEIEKNQKLRKAWGERFRWLLDDFKFVPGGRILTAAGTDQSLTYYNCMPPEQEVLTAEGYRPIGDIHVGDYVVTHRNRLRKVLRRFERYTREPIYVIKPKKLGYDALRVTGEHKVYAIRAAWVNKHRSRDGLRLQHEPAWIPAQELQVGDYLAVAYDGTLQHEEIALRVSDYIGIETLYEDTGLPIAVTAHSAYAAQNGKLQKVAVGSMSDFLGKAPLPLNNELLVDEDLCYLFGRYLGDGCIVHRTKTDIPAGIKIAFNLDELAAAERIAAIVEDKLGISASIKLSSTGRWYDLWVNSMPVGEFFKSLFGHYSYRKRIPTVLMRLPDYLTRALLRGLFQADGYISGSYIGMLLSNRELATQVHQLLLRLGYFFSIKENTYKLGKHPAYRLTAVASEAGDLFADFFNTDAVLRPHSGKIYLEYGGLRWIRIDGISIEDYEGTVLDLEVEEDHSFVSAGVVVSNCYVIPSPRDSREGIMRTLTEMTEIMSRGGGVGINLSTLRPRHAYVKGVNGRSSGSVSWGALYSFVTGLIEQGGCFGGDVRISTDKGLIPASELADRMDQGEVFYAHTHRGLRRITARFRNGVKPLYRVTTSRGYSVDITLDHKVAVLADGKITTTPLRYLQVGDEILLLLPIKLTSSCGKRDMYNTYPAQVWQSLGARTKYRQGIYDGVSERISFNQLVAIRERLVDAGELDAVARLEDITNVLPDVIASIEPLEEAEVFDFEVEDVHLLSGNGIYTSNSRRGALMLILNDWHPDVFDFINSKREAGNITNANISVGVSDKLMEAVKADGDWTLVFPDTSDPDYDELWDGDIDTWIASGRKVIPYRTVKARELWHAIIESAWASAEPGVWFRERSNKMANSWYFNPLVATNPCVSGDTRIYTDEGLVQARELFDEETAISVAIDGRFGVDARTLPASRVFMTGVKPVYRLQTREGYYLRATADHRIMTPSGWVELKDLQPGDKVHIMNRKGGFGKLGSLEEGRILGWLVGDGTIKSDRAVLSFFGEEKRELAPLFADYVNNLVAGMTEHRTYEVGVVEVVDRDEARVQSDRLRQIVAAYGLVENKHQVPEVVFKGTEEMQRGFLQALFTADGSFQGNTKTGTTVRLSSSHLPLLEQVQMLLSNFGIASRIYRNRRKAQYRLLPDGKGGKKQYWTKAQHELVIRRANLGVFAKEIGFLMAYKQDALEENLASRKLPLYAEYFYVEVESIVEDGVEEVYDLTEPITCNFIANGIIVHNCGEQPLGAYSVCNLGAINLARFYDADKCDVAWDDLRQAVRYAVRFLDNVIDSTPYFFPENEAVQQSERRIGLGTMGIAELMIRLGIRYGSDESVEFIDRLYELIATETYEASIELAKEKGAFPNFDAEKFLESGYMQQMPERIRQKIAEHGIRNVTLLTQAPTGTTGTMVNTSTGIEPFFSWMYYRKSRLGLHEEQVPLVREWYEQHPDAETLPDYFVTAMDLAPEDHVKVQAAIQRWVDSAISKTCNVPNEYTVEQVAELYEYMYDLGCKGGTIYRDGSRDEQVLMLKGDERAEQEAEQAKQALEQVKSPQAQASGHVDQVATPHHVYARPAKLLGATVSRQTPFGKAFITMNSDESGQPFEVFITVGKAGSDLQADAEGLGRMISLSLRTTAPQNRRAMLRLIIEQLEGIGGRSSVGFGPQRVLSLPDAVAGALKEHYFDNPEPQQLNLPINGGAHQETEPIETAAQAQSSGTMSNADICPECGTATFIRAEGCRKCLTCGYSQC